MLTNQGGIHCGVGDRGAGGKLQPASACVDDGWGADWGRGVAKPGLYSL